MTSNRRSVFRRLFVLGLAVIIIVSPAVFLLLRAKSEDKKPPANYDTLIQPSQRQKAKERYQHRENATFVSVAGNDDLYYLAETVRSVEDRFNKRYNYDWVFLNFVRTEGGFSKEFQSVMGNLVTGDVKFGVIDYEMSWSVPQWVDKEKLFPARSDTERGYYNLGFDKVTRIASLRNWNRFHSGLLFQHPLLQEYRYFWRVERSSQFTSNIHYDPFKFMRENNKDFAFSIVVRHFLNPILNLWNVTKTFLEENKDDVVIEKDGLLDLISDDGGETLNNCHFFAPFEIGNLDFWRGPIFKRYFEHLDKNGGFYYEGWGDDAVHSIAAALFIPKDRIHAFRDIAFKRPPYESCPSNESERQSSKAMCNPNSDTTWKEESCMRKYYELQGLQLPRDFEKVLNDGLFEGSI